MMFSKKAPKTKEETVTGTGKVGPVEVPSVPKVTPACGFEYQGRIYKTMDEANSAYQIELLKRRFPSDAFTYAHRNAWIPHVLGHWDEIRRIALMKLEVV